MIYLVYKTTNNISGKIYIGCHKTCNIDDNYLGSGVLIRKALLKYGRENFSKEILFVFDNPQDMYEQEKILVNELFIQQEDNYNLVVGGESALSYVNENTELFKSTQNRIEWARKGRITANNNGAHIKGRIKFKHLMEDEQYKEKHLIKVREAAIKRGSTFKNKKHTIETKTKMSLAKKNKYKGENNPNFGNCWIFNYITLRNKLIPLAELPLYIEQGWIKGRKLLSKDIKE